MKSSSDGFFVKLLTVLIFTVVFQHNLVAQDEIVTLSSGKKVILHSDKTWEYDENISYDFDFPGWSGFAILTLVRGDL